jgi:hypothetical protein
MKNKSLMIAALLVITCHHGLSQKDTLSITDSTGVNTAEKAVELILRADSIALADSFKHAVLIKQLKELRISERSKRQKIERELKEINLKDSLRQAQMHAEISRLKENAIGYPVIIHKDTLFSIYTKIGSLTPAERAEILSDRLNKLYREYFIRTDSLFLLDNGQSVDVFFQGQDHSEHH